MFQEIQKQADSLYVIWNPKSIICPSSISENCLKYLLSFDDFFLTLQKLCDNTKFADFYTIITNIRYHLRIVQQLQHITLADLNIKYNFLILKGFVSQTYNLKLRFEVCQFWVFNVILLCQKSTKSFQKKFHCRIQNQGHNF